jgi:hypothetical protein
MFSQPDAGVASHADEDVRAWLVRKSQRGFACCEPYAIYLEKYFMNW